MLMMLSHYVNDVLDTLMIPSVLEEVSDAFLQSRPDLIAYDLAEEVQSAMYI